MERVVREGACKTVDTAELDAAASTSVLNVESITVPVLIESIEVLENHGEYFVRSRSSDGAEGVAVTTNRMKYLYPLLHQCVSPVFIGQDARNLEDLIEEAYVQNSNYKLAGLALWCCIAWVEMSILDMLGKIAHKPIGDLLGGIVRKEIQTYIASGRRDTAPEEEVDILARGVEATGARAVKFKVGGRMRKDADSMLGRSDALIPLARKVLGDNIDIHADANGSYSPPKAIEIGKMLEEINAIFYEEPCPFDHLDETKEVADDLGILVAGGEQESSLRRFRWMIQHDVVQVLQPDVQYNGGFIRTIRVARMADKMGIPTTLHVSGEPGFVYTLHFASCTPNIGLYQEYKGHQKLGSVFDPPLKMKDGVVTIPTKPGLGMAHINELLRGARHILG